MAEELNSKLTGSDIRKFEQTLASFDATLARQEEIVKKILDAEKNIADVRLGALEPYFDAYSKGLDEIIARKTSKLNDAFLIMERKATESYKKAADAAIEEHKRIESSGDNNGSNNGSSNGGDSSGGGNSGQGGVNPPGNSIAVEVRTTLDDATRNKLGEEANTAENIVSRINTFIKKYGTVEEQLAASIKKEKDAVISIEQLKDARRTKRQQLNEKYIEKEKELEKTLTALTMARLQEKQDRELRVQAVRISQIQEAADAELATQNLINEISAKRIYNNQHVEEVGELSARKSKAADSQKSIQQIEDARIAYITKKELEAKRKNNGILRAEDAASIKKQADAKFKIDKENIDRLNKRRAEADANEAAKKRGTELQTNRTALLHGSWYERKEAFHNLTHNDSDEVDKEQITANIAATMVSTVDGLVHKLGDFAKQLNNKIDEIGSYKSAIDTRLQGSSNKTSEGSYWDQMVKDMTSIGAVNPYFKQSDFASNIKSLVEQGIAFDLEQRAFLMTIQNKIANTFEVADGTLLRLIRIQQEDSTAGRLGMEAALNSFLNNMYENTEYLKQVADGVRSSLTEMQSLMEGAEATEVEYQVQKWLGSLYSVGMSNEAVNSISQTLGQLGAGQIEGLTNGGAGNLLVMAASDAGLSIADILTGGIDSKETNKLMQAIVNYLAEIAESSKGNNVVQQQLANVFGVKASDLRAATNLASKGSVGAIYNSSMTYDNMLGYLFDMAGSMGDRTSLTEQITNVWENVQYSLAGSIASNPATYMIYKLATVLDDTTGGIAIPAVSVLGNMVDLHTTIADLMRVGAISGGVLGSLGDLMSGLSNSFSGQSMLTQLGISSGGGAGLVITPRGDGSLLKPIGGGNQTVSESGYGRMIGNTSGNDIKNSTMQEANDSKKQLMVEAQEEEEANQINVLNATVLKIYELLDDVARGSGCFRVKVDNYGLTKAGSISAQGGPGALGSLGSENTLGSGISNSSSSGGMGSLSGGGVNSGGISGSVDFGGWTTVM